MHFLFFVHYLEYIHTVIRKRDFDEGGVCEVRDIFMNMLRNDRCIALEVGRADAHLARSLARSPTPEPA